MSSAGAAPSSTTAVITGRNIGGIVANVTPEERHNDRLSITRHPVELGAAITDHAFKENARLTVMAAWSNAAPSATGDSYVRDIYQQLLAQQVNRQPVQVVTGKRTYQNMLTEGLALTTDEKTEFALFVTVDLFEVILVQTVTTSATPVSASSDAGAQADPANTSQTQARGAVQVTPGNNYNFTAGSASGITGSPGGTDPLGP